MITRKEIIKLTKPVITKVLANVNSEKWYYDTKYIVNYNNNVYCANNKYVDIRITNYEPSKLNGATLLCTVYLECNAFTIWHTDTLKELDKFGLHSTLKNYLLLLGFTEE